MSRWRARRARAAAARAAAARVDARVVADADAGAHADIEPSETVAPDDRFDLIAFPHYPNNPFQSIVYGALPAGTELITPVDVAALAAALAECDAAATVLHLNWTAPIAQTAPTVEAADAAVEAFLAGLDDFRAHGGTLVWTVHNTLPHELNHRDAELRLCRAIVDRADAIEVMNPATAALVADAYALPPEKTVVHAHPSYRGRFPDEVSRTDARSALGLDADADAPVVLLFGTLRPYKGVDEVVAAFVRARAARPELVLLVAGEIGAGFSEEGLRELLDHEGIVSRLGYVPSDDTQLWLRAADALVLPYRSALNPSLVYLAATFGRPVLLSALPSLEYLAGERWVHPVDYTRAEELPAALLAALDEARRDAETEAAAATSFAAQRDPALVAHRFAAFLASVRAAG